MKRNYWDEEANYYEKETMPTINVRYINSMFRTIFERWSKNSGQGKKILELGSGVGNDAIYYTKKGFQVYAIDESQKMIDISIRKAKKHGLIDKITFDKKKFQELGDVDSKFDYILSSFGPLNFEFELEKLAEILANKSNPRTIMIFSLMNKFSISDFVSSIINRRFKEFLIRTQSRPVIIQSKYTGCTAKIRFYSPNEIKKAFSQYFETIKIYGLLNFITPHYYNISNLSFPIKCLIWLDQCLMSNIFFRHLGDCYIIVLKKK